MRRPFSAFIIAGVLCLGGRAAQADAGKIYAALKTVDGVAVIDAVTFDTWGIIETGKRPTKLKATPDGRLVFTCLYTEGKVQAIDTVTEKVIKTIEVGDRPYALDITPDGKILVVGCGGGQSVSIVDTDKLKEIKRFETLGHPNEVRVSPDGRFAYAVNSDAPMQVIDLRKLELKAEVEIPRDVYETAFSPDGGTMYLNSLIERTVVFMDTVKWTPVKKLSAGSQGLALSPDGKEIWFGGGGDRLTVYSIGEDKAVAELRRKSTLTNLVIRFSPDGKVVFAAPAGDEGDKVYVFDAKKKEKIGEITVRGGVNDILLLGR